jgi:serine/threonine-protein kinase RIO1
MKPPARLQSLIEEGLIDSVVRQLMSGKEAVVFVTRTQHIGDAWLRLLASLLSAAASSSCPKSRVPQRA